jgi:hypothetical protein
MWLRLTDYSTSRPVLYGRLAAETREAPLTDNLMAQIPELEKQADELEHKAHAIRQIIAGVRALNGDADSVFTRSFESHRRQFEIAMPDPSGPRGPEAVLQVMREHPGRQWKVVDLKRQLLRRGWAPTPKAVEASVKRLRVAGKVMNVSYGWYQLAPDECGSTATEPDEPGGVRSGLVRTPQLV